MRSSQRLNVVRSLPCVKCGNPNSQAAHSNFTEHGKGRGIKASDESKVWFEQMLVKTNRMLSLDKMEIF